MPLAKSSDGAALPYFADWLVENVHLVEITAYTDGDAYTIFETMNDRGLSLTPADMLKGWAAQTVGSGNQPCVAESHGNAFGALAMALAPCPPGTPQPQTDRIQEELNRRLRMQMYQQQEVQGAGKVYQCQRNGGGYYCQ